jgi:hypothetical protein
MASNNYYLTISQLHDNNTPWDTLSITQKQYARNQGWNKSKWIRTLETHNNNSTEPNIVFLDIDGVVHSTNSSGGPAHNAILLEKMPLIVNLIKSTNATLVISSNWRGTSSKMTQIKNKLQDLGYTKDIYMLDNNYNTNFDGLLLLPDNEHKKERSTHIRNYLQNHSHNNFVIIDDTKEHISSEFTKNYVQTNSLTGISYEDLHKVHSILNTF